MSIFDRFKAFRNPVVELEVLGEEKRSRASTLIDEDTANPYGYSVTPGYSDLGLPGEEPYAFLLQKYGRVVWVYIAINIISTSLSEVNFKVIDKRKKGKPNEGVKGTGMGLLDLLARPNKWFTELEFKELLAMHLLSTGNAFIEKAEMDGYGRPRELFILNPKNMAVIPSKTDFIAGYIYTVNGKQVTFKPEEIIHIKLPDPRGESHLGMSPLSALRIVIDHEWAALDWNTAFFKNATWPSGIITCKDGLNAEEFKRAKKELKLNYEGKNKVGKVLILTGGMEWQQTTPNPKDIDFLNLRRATREDILSVFRVPPSIAGIYQFENTTSRSAGVREQHIQFWSQTIKPLASRILTRLNNELVPAFSPNYEIIPDVSGIPALKETDEQKKIRAETAALLVEKVGWTPSMVNAELYPDVPVVPWGEQPSPNYNSFSGTFANITGADENGVLAAQAAASAAAKPDAPTDKPKPKPKPKPKDLQNE